MSDTPPVPPVGTPLDHLELITATLVATSRELGTQYLSKYNSAVKEWRVAVATWSHMSDELPSRLRRWLRDNLDSQFALVADADLTAALTAVSKLAQCPCPELSGWGQNFHDDGTPGEFVGGSDERHRLAVQALAQARSGACVAVCHLRRFRDWVKDEVPAEDVRADKGSGPPGNTPDQPKKGKVKGKAKRPGNPCNRLTVAEKRERQKRLTEWLKAKGMGKTLNEFLEEFPREDRSTIRAHIKTAQKWKQQKSTGR